MAALVHNRRAVSIGTSSFGKGVTQDVIELSDGSGLILTSGELLLPDGTRHHGKGIAPLHALSEGTGDDACLTRTRALMGNTRDPAPLAESPPSPRKKPETAPDPPAPARKGTEASEPDFFLCFDKDFTAEEQAHEWLGILDRSIPLEEERYLFQRHAGEGIRFFPCLGPYGGKERADKARLRLSKAVVVPMSIRTIESLAADAPSPEFP